MLPKQLTDLTDGFVKSFDSERPPVIEFRKIHNKGAEWAVQSGVGWGGGASLGVIAKGLTEYLREKALFVRDKLQQVVTSTEIKFYAELNTDLKSQFAAYLNPCLKGAEDYFETLRKSTLAPTGFTDQLRMDFNSIVPRINADLDLFCADYEAKERNRKQQSHRIEHVVANDPSLATKKAKRLIERSAETGSTPGILSQEGLIKTAKKIVPSFKWAIGGAGLLALAAIVLKWQLNLATLFLVAGVLLVLGMAFVALQWISKLQAGKTSMMAAFVAWSLLVMLVVSLGFVVSSAALNWPWPFRSWIEKQLNFVSTAEPPKIAEPVTSLQPTAVDHADGLTNWITTASEVLQAKAISKQARTNVAWVDDALPAGAVAGASGEDAWTWVNLNPIPNSGTVAHQSASASALHEHWFDNATSTLYISTGDTLYAYVYLDPSNVPSEVMLAWNNGSWEHRAYWGANDIAYGISGTASRSYLGPLPAAGQWVRLEVPASQVGLEESILKGMDFSAYGGRVTWDNAGVSSN